MASHKTGLLNLPHGSSFSKANSAVPRQIQVLLLLKSAQKFSCPCLWQHQKWGFHKCAIQEAEELQCKSLDRNCTKENRPFCPDASKVMRLSYDIPEGEFTCIQGIWLIKQFILKKEYLFFINPFCVLGGKKEGGDDEEESLGQTMRFLSI